MSGAGNDFIVLACVPEVLEEDPASFVRRLCRRGLSVGADGVLFVTPGGGAADADAVLVHYNADGGRSDFCGNGSRCAARFARLMGFAASSLVLRTDAGRLRAEVAGDTVRIEVPSPSEPVPRLLEIGQGEQKGWYAIGTGRAAQTGWYVVAGVPHFVVLVDAPENIDVPVLGPFLRSHPAFGSEGANIDFVGPCRENRRRIRTFERGVEGETLACGSGAIATAAVLGREGEPSPIVLTPASGIDLTVEFEVGPNGPRGFRLTGEARIVFEGILGTGLDEAGRLA